MKVKNIIFKNCRFSFETPDKNGIHTGRSIVVSGKKILDIGPAEAIEKRYGSGPDTEVVDCSDKIVMPGLMDGHNHLCNTHMNMARAFRLDYDNIAKHMLTTIHNPYGWLTEESIYDISMASIINDVKHGATTIESSTILPDTAYRAMDDAGIRGILAPQMATSFRLDSEPLNWKQYLAQAERCIKDYHRPEERMSVAVHIHDLWDCTERLMTEAYQIAEDYDVKYVLHFWEFADAVRRGDALWPEGAFEHYMNLGIVTDRSVLFHGSMLQPEEIERLAETGASVIHNPDINGTNCGNCAYIPKMLEAGVNVGLGCDYGSLDVMTSMKLMLMIHNIMPRPLKGLDYWEPFKAATLGTARAYGLEKQTGSLEVGKRADIITIDLKKASHMLPMCTALLDVQPELLYFLFTRNCAGTTTAETMVDGQFIRRNGEFTQIDEERYVAKAAEWCEKCMTDLTDAFREKHYYARIIHPDFTKDEDIPEETLL